MCTFAILWVRSSLCGDVRVLKCEGLLFRGLVVVQDVGDELINLLACWIFRRS